MFLYVYMDKYYCISVFAYIMNSFMPFMKNIRVFASIHKVVFLYAYVDRCYFTSVFAYVMNSFRDMSLYGRICMHGQIFHKCHCMLRERKFLCTLSLCSVLYNIFFSISMQ